MSALALTVAEAAETLAVHPNTIRNAIDRGDLTPIRLGRVLRVPKREIDALLDGAASASPDLPGGRSVGALGVPARALDRNPVAGLPSQEPAERPAPLSP